MNKIKTLLIMIAAFVGMVTFVPNQVLASPATEIQKGVTDIGGNEKGNKASDLNDRIKTIVNIIMYAVGAIAVLMILIGGLRYILSNGDSSGISGAKNTILYAVIGLVVTIMSYAIVNFVIDSFVK